MTIFKTIGGNRRSLPGMVHYITDDIKCKGKVFALNASSNPEIAIQEMEAIKNLHDKNEGRLYKQFVFSFDRDIRHLSEEDIMEISHKICAYYGNDYQIIGAVHFDTCNVHVQFILNTINMRTGRKFSQSQKDLFDYKRYINTIVEEYGLNPVEYYGRETESVTDLEP